MDTSVNPERKPVIGFDMGGTSTDVSRFAGQYEHVWSFHFTAFHFDHVNLK